MEDDRYSTLPGPDEPEDEHEEERTAEHQGRADDDEPRSPRKNTAPDYRKFVGNPWYKRRWVQSYLVPAGVIAFAAIVLISRTTSAVKTAFEQTPGREASVGELRQGVRSNIRAQRPPFRPPAVAETQPETEQSANAPSNGGNDYWQQIAEEKRRHRIEAFASPIFAEASPTGKPAQVAQPTTAIPDLSGVDLSGLSSQQTALLKRYLEAQSALESSQMPAPAPPLLASNNNAVSAPIAPQAASPNSSEAQRQSNVALNQAEGPFHRILPGTVVEAALDTALESTLTGVVLAHLCRDVHTNNLLGPVLLPAGTQLVGEAAPVTSLNQPRLKVTFDLAIEPNGYSINLDQFKAMNQQGETGLADSVSNHWMRTIGISAVVGVIEGLSQFGYAGVNILSPRTEIYTGIGSEAGREGIRILDRFLNVPPTVKVNPGSRIRIVFPVGLDGVPEYQNTHMPVNL